MLNEVKHLGHGQKQRSLMCLAQRSFAGAQDDRMRASDRQESFGHLRRQLLRKSCDLAALFV
jgi:hypothetical protein